MLLTQIAFNRRADEFDPEKDATVAKQIRDFYLDGGGDKGDGEEDDGDVVGHQDEARGGEAFCERNKEKIVQMFGDAFCFGGER